MRHKTHENEVIKTPKHTTLDDDGGGFDVANIKPNARKYYAKHVSEESVENVTIYYILFGLGFFTIFTWWIAAFCVPAQTRNARKWRSVNRTLTNASLVAITCVLIFILNLYNMEIKR